MKCDDCNQNFFFWKHLMFVTNKKMKNQSIKQSKQLTTLINKVVNSKNDKTYISERGRVMANVSGIERGLWRTDVILKERATWQNLKNQIEKKIGTQTIYQKINANKQKSQKNVNWKNQKT